MRAVAPQFVREPGESRRRSIRWLSGRALLLHLALVLSVPVCLFAAWWQVQRALSGNTLSFVYVFEWPAFAGVATWAWLALLTGSGRDAADASAGWSEPHPDRPGQDLLSARTCPLHWDCKAESVRLRAYNAYLAEINSQPLRRGRLPRRPREARHG